MSGISSTFYEWEEVWGITQADPWLLSMDVSYHYEQ